MSQYKPKVGDLICCKKNWVVPKISNNRLSVPQVGIIIKSRYQQQGAIFFYKVYFPKDKTMFDLTYNEIYLEDGYVIDAVTKKKHVYY